ncbi:MAG: hypothetical protein HUJ65_05435, partial [Oscillospiraceae bacterium]|nr:hypothetical protein [Oscillospiraceae bacterium]
AADYYNKQGLYYSAETDAEMSLILSECALLLDISEFDENIVQFERAERTIDFSGRYDLARAEFLLRTGETELACRILDTMSPVADGLNARKLYVDGLRLICTGELEYAREKLLQAESVAPDEYLPLVYSALERCFKELEDYKQAYFYASKQLRK